MRNAERDNPKVKVKVKVNLWQSHYVRNLRSKVFNSHAHKMERKTWMTVIFRSQLYSVRQYYARIIWVNVNVMIFLSVTPKRRFDHLICWSAAQHLSLCYGCSTWYVQSSLQIVIYRLYIVMYHYELRHTEILHYDMILMCKECLNN